MVCEIKVARVRGVRIAMLVGGPVELGRICVPRPDVLGLKVLQLAVNVVSLAHSSTVGRVTSGVKP